MRYFFSVAFSVLLVACGGGGGGSEGTTTTPATAGPSAEGVYGGTLSGDTTSTAVQLLVLENGEFWSMYGTQSGNTFGVAGFIQGAGTSNNGRFTSSNTKDFGYAPAIAGSATATYDATAKTISGTWTLGTNHVNFNGGPIPGSIYNYDTAATLTAVAGTWSTTSVTGEHIALTVAANGSYTAAGGSGCNYSGTITPRASGKNVFDVSITFGAAPCALAGKSGTGIAVVYPTTGGLTQLLLAATDSTHTFGSAIFGTRPSALASSTTLANLCVAPRPGTVDKQGTMADEKAYLRSFVDETYLWYKDVPNNLVAANYVTPQAYFDDLKTTAKTASGAWVDQFHWSQTTASWDAYSSGISEDYGIQWAAQASTPPRNWIVAEVVDGSPAALAGVKRGDKVTSIDGVDFVYGNADILNQGLSPATVAPHQFGFNGSPAISLTPVTLSTATVQKVKTFTTATDTVGYFVFDTHIAKSEAELIAAINQLKAANVNDLIIDMRYNGGGLLYIASELAYMVAGPTTTTGKTFERLTYNDKLTANNTAYPFYSVGTTQTLPHLDLSHVTILTTYDTASASESVINSLRGVDVAVDIIGTTTRGKPYGFVPQDNCGYTYFAIQFKGVNNKGFGDYSDGFTPTCNVADDFTHARGDTAEAMLATALSYRQTKVCPAVAVASRMLSSGRSLGYKLVRPASQEMRILTDMPRL